MTDLPTEDGDDRPHRMARDPGGYFDAAWTRGEDEVLAERAARPPARSSSRHARPRPTRGVVEMRLRGHTDMDVLKLVQRMRAAGFTVWAAPSRSYQDANGSIRRYFAVDLREESGG